MYYVIRVESRILLLDYASEVPLLLPEYYRHLLTLKATAADDIHIPVYLLSLFFRENTT